MARVSTKHHQGALVHPELVCPEHDGDCAFYCRLFGWGIYAGVANARTHSIATSGGGDCAGLAHTSTRTDEVPTGWGPYLAVDDVDTTCKAVNGRGGNVVQAPRDVGNFGRIAFATDATGAGFGMWQAGPILGTHSINEAGTLCLAELVTPDPQRSIDFYRHVFGYEVDSSALERQRAVSLRVSNEPDNLVISKQTSMAPRTRSRWLIHFGVSDLDLAVGTAITLGADLIAGPEEGPRGRVAFLRDPHGATFGLLQ